MIENILNIAQPLSGPYILDTAMQRGSIILHTCSPATGAPGRQQYVPAVCSPGLSLSCVFMLQTMLN